MGLEHFLYTVTGAACSVFGPSKDAALLEGSKIFMKVGPAML